MGLGVMVEGGGGLGLGVHLPRAALPSWGPAAPRRRPAGTAWSNEIDVSLPDNQCQHRTLNTQKDVLPYALC